MGEQDCVGGAGGRGYGEGGEEEDEERGDGDGDGVGELAHRGFGFGCVGARCGIRVISETDPILDAKVRIRQTALVAYVSAGRYVLSETSIL